MKHLLFLFTIATIVFNTKDLQAKNIPPRYIQTSSITDTARLADLDAYWEELARTVNEGDFEGYSNAYHEDAVVVFAVGQNKSSVPIATALANWKQGFMNTKAGKQFDKVAFRLSQRIGNETTAHETGIFHFQSKNNKGEITNDAYVHFEMLLVKKDNSWIALMEYQKETATQNQWDAIK